MPECDSNVWGVTGRTCTPSAAKALLSRLALLSALAEPAWFDSRATHIVEAEPFVAPLDEAARPVDAAEAAPIRRAGLKAPSVADRALGC